MTDRCPLCLGTRKRDTMLRKLDEATNRFLGWKLPENFSPDGGISYTPRYFHIDQNADGPVYVDDRPTGTNLLDITQARAMLAYVLDLNP